MTLSNVTQDSSTSSGTLSKMGQTTTFDLIVSVLSTWFIIGLFMDGWAHSNLPETQESFFTPWHGVLYSGFFATGAALYYVILNNTGKGFSFKEAIPDGYKYGALGVILFLVGGVGDMIWHETLGIEVDIEALFSPTHLLLLLGAFLMIASPLVKLSIHPDKMQDTTGQLAASLSATVSLSAIVFFTAFASPIRSPLMQNPNSTGNSSYIVDGLGFISFLWQMVLLLGFIYYLTRRINLKPGMIFLVVALSKVLATTQEPTFYYIPYAIIGGLLVEIVYQLTKGENGLKRPRVFAALSSFLLMVTYVVNTALVPGIGWSFELWGGAITATVMISVLLSFVFYPVEQIE